MKKRLFNIFFNIHTVAGIFISAILFVMFFTGTLSFLRDEFIAWERNQPILPDNFHKVDFDYLLHYIGTVENLDNRNLSFEQYYEEEYLLATLSERLSENSESEEKSLGDYFMINYKTASVGDYEEDYSVGELIYRLHFLAPLNIQGRYGYMLAGFVSFFFLIVLMTGIYIHWDKMISHFYVFRATAKWKTIWTDSHITMGFIGLPFQLIYAITGCALLLSASFFINPAIDYLYSKNSDAYYKNTEVTSPIELSLSQQRLTNDFSINHLITNAKELQPDLVWTKLKIDHINNKNMTVEFVGHLPYKKDVSSQGLIKFKVESGEILDQVNPEKSFSYSVTVNNILHRLHFGDFGGYPLKIIFMVLGFLSSYVIISGVMIWYVARDKKTISPRKRRINFFLTKLYLSISLALIPIIAMSLIASKLNNLYFGITNKAFLYHTFYYGWGVLIIVLMTLRSFKQIVTSVLILIILFSFIIPLMNGLTNKWIWETLNPTFISIFSVDFLWCVIGMISLYALMRLNKQFILY
ncbi:MAG: PepSY-associated TM helix domain-containing protein [Weeksellaceae bacterium]